MNNKKNTIVRFYFQETAVKPPEDMPEVIDDFDIGEDEEVAVENRYDQ